MLPLLGKMNPQMMQAAMEQMVRAARARACTWDSAAHSGMRLGPHAPCVGAPPAAVGESHLCRT